MEFRVAISSRDSTMFICQKEKKQSYSSGSIVDKLAADDNADHTVCQCMKQPVCYLISSTASCCGSYQVWRLYGMTSLLLLRWNSIWTEDSHGTINLTRSQPRTELLSNTDPTCVDPYPPWMEAGTFGVLLDLAKFDSQLMSGVATCENWRIPSWNSMPCIDKNIGFKLWAIETAHLSVMWPCNLIWPLGSCIIRSGRGDPLAWTLLLSQASNVFVSGVCRHLGSSSRKNRNPDDLHNRSVSKNKQNAPTHHHGVM